MCYITTHLVPCLLSPKQSRVHAKQLQVTQNGVVLHDLDLTRFFDSNIFYTCDVGSQQGVHQVKRITRQ